MRFQIYQEQQLDCSIAEAWRFFSSPNNLSKITPKSMAFTVLTKDLVNEIFEGMLIDYSVAPLFGIEMKWQTRILKVEYQNSFVDFQVRGPYKYWNHLHEFECNENGVLMKDTVDYELPFGFIGNVVHSLLVKRKLIDIFDYRKKVLDRMFNNA